jgi:hypothetical protein
MRIAISGTHCVGKTTLIDDFLKIHPEYVYEEEPYYQLQEEHGIEFSVDPNLEEIIEQLNFNIERLDAYEDRRNVIFERCPLDFVAYSIYLAHQEEMDFKDTTVFHMFPEIKEALENLDLIVFLPMTREYPIHCPESEDENSRNAVDAILKRIYREEMFDLLSSDGHTQVIELWGSPEERIKKLGFYWKENGLT